MQVHDELVLEVREDAIASVTTALHDRMDTAAELKVPLKIEVGRRVQLGRGSPTRGPRSSRSGHGAFLRGALLRHASGWCIPGRVA